LIIGDPQRRSGLTPVLATHYTTGLRAARRPTPLQGVRPQARDVFDEIHAGRSAWHAMQEEVTLRLETLR
jgi:hypothetical protein